MKLSDNITRVSKQGLKKVLLSYLVGFHYSIVRCMVTQLTNDRKTITGLLWTVTEPINHRWTLDSNTADQSQVDDNRAIVDGNRANQSQVDSNTATNHRWTVTQPTNNR